MQRVLDHRDPHFVRPPLRPDPQSYRALSDYLLTYSFSSLCCIISAMILMLVPPLRRFHATPLDDAVTFFDFRAHIGQLVSRFVTSVPRVGSDVFN